ncbi:MAG: hypothetical protein ACK5GV_01125 [Bacteroidota bacterium]|jgi:hypothetical protein
MCDSKNKSDIIQKSNAWAETVWDESDLPESERSLPETLYLAKAAGSMGYTEGWCAAMKYVESICNSTFEEWKNKMNNGESKKDMPVELPIAPMEPIQPNMVAGSFVGSCGKCGAPYIMYTGAWMSVTPPPIQPSCNCWNRTVITTTTTK